MWVRGAEVRLTDPEADPTVAAASQATDLEVDGGAPSEPGPSCAGAVRVKREWEEEPPAPASRKQPRRLAAVQEDRSLQPEEAESEGAEVDEEDDEDVTVVEAPLTALEPTASSAHQEAISGAGGIEEGEEEEEEVVVGEEDAEQEEEEEVEVQVEVETEEVETEEELPAAAAAENEYVGPSDSSPPHRRRQTARQASLVAAATISVSSDEEQGADEPPEALSFDAVRIRLRGRGLRRRHVDPLVGCVVWAKVHGFPSWPATVLLVHAGQAKVRFCATHDLGVVAKHGLVLFQEKPDHRDERLGDKRKGPAWVGQFDAGILI